MTRRGWRIFLLPAVIALLVGSHGLALYYVSSHTALSATVVAVAVLMVLLKHLGLLAPLFAIFRRRRR